MGIGVGQAPVPVNLHTELWAGLPTRLSNGSWVWQDWYCHRASGMWDNDGTLKMGPWESCPQEQYAAALVAWKLEGEPRTEHFFGRDGKRVL